MIEQILSEIENPGKAWLFRVRMQLGLRAINSDLPSYRLEIHLYAHAVADIGPSGMHHSVGARYSLRVVAEEATEREASAGLKAKSLAAYWVGTVLLPSATRFLLYLRWSSRAVTLTAKGFEATDSTTIASSTQTVFGIECIRCYDGW